MSLLYRFVLAYVPDSNTCIPIPWYRSKFYFFTPYCFKVLFIDYERTFTFWPFHLNFIINGNNIPLLRGGSTSSFSLSGKRGALVNKDFYFSHTRSSKLDDFSYFRCDFPISSLGLNFVSMFRVQDEREGDGEGCRCEECLAYFYFSTTLWLCVINNEFDRRSVIEEGNVISPSTTFIPCVSPS